MFVGELCNLGRYDSFPELVVYETNDYTLPSGVM